MPVTCGATRRIAGGTLVVAGLIASAAMLTAQTPASRPGAPEQPADPSPVVKATGCLERADARGTESGVQRPPKSGGVSSQFVLTGARLGGVGIASSVNPSTSSDESRPQKDGPQSSATSARLRVAGLSASQLQTHVDHQVELEGRLQHQGPGSTTPTGDVGTPENTRTTGTPGTSGTTGSGTPSLAGTASGVRGQTRAERYAPTFEATAIRTIAATCAGGS